MADNKNRKENEQIHIVGTDDFQDPPNTQVNEASQTSEQPAKTKKFSRRDILIFVAGATVGALGGIAGCVYAGGKVNPSAIAAQAIPQIPVAAVN